MVVLKKHYGKSADPSILSDSSWLHYPTTSNASNTISPATSVSPYFNPYAEFTTTPLKQSMPATTNDNSSFMGCPVTTNEITAEQALENIVYPNMEHHHPHASAATTEYSPGMHIVFMTRMESVIGTHYDYL